MCTAISDFGNLHLFGRTLDFERSFGEEIIICPRNFDLSFAHLKGNTSGYAIMGIAYNCGGHPLFFDGVNEKGLAAAGLNFPYEAKYFKPKDDKKNLCSYEVIPFLLRHCKSVAEAMEALDSVNITDENFSSDLPATPLHWIIADKNSTITIESTESGLSVYQNPLGILTNSPNFAFQMTNLANYAYLSPQQPTNQLCKSVDLPLYSRGMGGLGLPGDFSSCSRFIRAVFAKSNTRAISENQEISRFFHILDCVSQPLGCVMTDDGRPVYTVYTSCYDTQNLICHFTTYSNRRIRAIRLPDYSLDGNSLISFSMTGDEDISYAKSRLI